MNMKELAEIAGVSSAAVSRYINGGPLSQEKKERIRIAIEQTNYKPDTAAQTLRTGTSDQIGIILPKIDSGAMSRFTAGAIPALLEEGYLTLLADTSLDIEREISYLSLFQSRSVAGIILMGSLFTPRLADVLNTLSVPVVIVGQQFKNLSCVYYNDFDAAYDLTSLILKKGRKHIGFIGTTDKDVAVGLNRRRGVQAAMKDFGLSPDSLCMQIGDLDVSDGSYGMKKLLVENPQIDGVVCVTDRIAIGAMETLRAAGKRIPEDVSICGMDDLWVGQYLSPALTTSHFYYKTCGEKAAKLLVDLIRQKDNPGPTSQIMLGYSIMERGSV